MSETRPLRVGVVGCGVVATAYYLPYMLRHRADFVLAAVCDSNGRRARACARLFEAPQAFEDYGEMLAKSELDAVLILTGPGTHARFAIMAAEAGLHFILQKPMATTMEDAHHIAEVVRRNRVIALIEPSDHSLLDPRYREVRRLVKAGVLGDPYWFSLVPLGPDHPHPSLGGNPYGIGAFYSKDSGGYLFDFPYAPSQIVTVLGDCRSVQGLAKISAPARAVVPDEEYDKYLESRQDPFHANYWEVVVDLPKTLSIEMEAPDNVYSLYEMANGWIGVFHAGRLFHPVPKGLTGGGLGVWGTQGNLVFGHGGHFASISTTRAERLETVDEHGWFHVDEKADYTRSRWPIPAPGSFNYYEASTAHLLECWREGREPLIGVEWGRHITEMMCGAMISAETGRRYEMTTTTAGMVTA